MKKHLLVFFLALSGCISSKVFVGTYIESSFGDTLILGNDKRYYYNEKLYTGFWGSTEGMWKNMGNTIFFTANRKALTGYSIKLKKEQLDGQLKIQLLLGDTETPVDITGLRVLKGGQDIVELNNSFSKNTIQLSPSPFDSVLIATDEFVPLRLSNRTMQHGYVYQVRIYPVERLYELDKAPMQRKGTLLITKPSERFNYIKNRFYKISFTDFPKASLPLPG